MWLMWLMDLPVLDLLVWLCSWWKCLLCLMCLMTLCFMCLRYLMWLMWLMIVIDVIDVLDVIDAVPWYVWLTCLIRLALAAGLCCRFKNHHCCFFGILVQSERRLLYMWGSNKSQQLGLPVEQIQELLVPTSIPFAHQPVVVECGPHHTVVLTIENEVLTAGDNHYGQLGRGRDKSIIVSAKSNDSSTSSPNSRNSKPSTAESNSSESSG